MSKDSISIVPIQQCRSLDGWQPIEVESRTDPDVRYVVQVNPWGDENENICSCKGYHYRGNCAHQKMAHTELCAWSEEVSLERQSPDMRREMICPRCRGATMWVMGVEE